MANTTFRLLERFRQTFKGKIYKHRDSSLGNKIGRELFEDLFDHSDSPGYAQHVRTLRGLANRGGRIHTPRAIRRNDSVLGKPPAGIGSRKTPRGFSVPEGPVAEPRIGCEVKILAKSQLKQIDRVINDLDGFAQRMKSLNRRCINVAIIGVNHEANYVGYEGSRAFRHELREQEPKTVIQRIKDQLLRRYDELLILQFRATNQRPYPFNWLDPRRVELDYGAALTRISELYQRRFG